MSKNTKRPTEPQSQKFIDKAKELGADEDEKAFEDKLRRIAKQQPKKETPDK